MGSKSVLKATTDSELLSYIINVTPELQEIDLPKQGESIKPIGQIIMNDTRYRNAFINAVNLIGLTVIHRNGYESPWKFTTRGTLNFGESVREMMLDLVDPHDYNEEVNNAVKFLENEVPNVFEYIHQLNYQKFYKTTTSDAQMAMAFNGEGQLFDFIDACIEILYTSMQTDLYYVDKYQLCRRMLDGTITAVELADYDNLTPRQRVSKIKAISNKMTFISPNYNPAGIRQATAFDRQMVILDSDFEADFSTEVMATSYFRDEAQMRARMELIDGFNNHDTNRLALLLKDQYVAFTEADLTALGQAIAVIMDEEWFQDYDYALDNASGERMTEFFNPQSLRNNHFLHIWKVVSTSPFKNACVVTKGEPAVSTVTVTPAEATVMAGQTIQLAATVTTTAFANKAVQWTVEAATGETTGKVTVDLNGKVTVPADYTPDEAEAEGSITIRATSVYNPDKYDEAVISVL